MFLHINTSKTWRGGENQLFLLAQGLKERNFQQIVLCNEHSPLAEKCKKENIRFLTLTFDKKFQFFSNLNKIQQIITKNNIKVIHAHTAKSHTFGLLSKIRSKQLKLIIARRVDFHIQKNFLSHWKYKTKLNDYFICVSQNIRNILIKDGLTPDKLVTVYSGIDLKKNSLNCKNKELHKEFDLDKDYILIGNVAALVEHKDQKTLLKAISQIQTDKKYKFLIVGEGKLKKKLEKQCKSLNLQDKVIFTGFRTDIENILDQLDIFTLTSKEEGLGTSLLDAMKKGSTDCCYSWWWYCGSTNRKTRFFFNRYRRFSNLSKILHSIN